MIEVDAITFMLIQLLGFFTLSTVGRLLGKQIKRAIKRG